MQVAASHSSEHLEQQADAARRADNVQYLTAAVMGIAIFGLAMLVIA